MKGRIKLKKSIIINDLYFEQKKTLTEIAKILNTSISYISKILRKNDKYQVIKKQRKEENLVKRRSVQKELIYNERRNKIDIEYTNMKNKHIQASKELSKHTTISNQALRKWASSSYNYNKEKKRYEFDIANLVKPADFPMYIN